MCDIRIVYIYKEDNMKSVLTLGLDLGNFNTKTQNQTIPSGFVTMNTLPYGAETYLKFNGVYYLPDEQRFPYERDKTINENAFILSILAISSEILREAEKQNKKKEEAALKDEKKQGKVLGVQGEIEQLKEIRLGVGLPPTHVATLKEKTVKYYEDRLKNGISYEYNGYVISFKLKDIKCYPQDFAAVLTYKPKDRETSAVSYPTFYAVDIGGWTVDIVTVLNGKPAMSKCDSKPLGILAMYEKMTREVEQKTGKRLSQTDLENILKGGKTLLKEDVIKEIKACEKEWYESIIKSLRQFGLDLEMHPVIFVGGGAQLFRKLISADKTLVKYEFIPSPRANAIAYATLMEAGK